MYYAITYRLLPSLEQATKLRQAGGNNRFLYNQLIDIEKNAYEKDKKYLKYTALSKEINKLQKDYEFLCISNKQSLQQKAMDLDRAYKNFFEGRAKHPKYHRKGDGDSVRYPQSCAFNFEESTITLPKIGQVKAIFHRYAVGTLRSITVNIGTDGIFEAVCLLDDGLNPPTIPNYANSDIDLYSLDILGVDFNLGDLAVCSDGRRYENIRAFKQYESRIGRIRRQMDKLLRLANPDNYNVNGTIKKRAEQKPWVFTQNYKKLQKKLGKLHRDIRNARKAWLDQVSSDIVYNTEAPVIALEDLNVAGMVKNPFLAKYISDAAFGTLRRMIEYKCIKAGRLLIVIDRFAPSSQICNVCGYRNRDLKDLKIRNWYCPVCGTDHERDDNASKTISNFARRLLLEMRKDAKGGMKASEAGIKPQKSSGK